MYVRTMLQNVYHRNSFLSGLVVVDVVFAGGRVRLVSSHISMSGGISRRGRELNRHSGRS